MSEYKLNDYIMKKVNDINQKESTTQAYKLGVALGMLEAYKECKMWYGEEATNKIFKRILCGNEEFNNTFRTMVVLYNKETNLKTQKLVKMIQTHKDDCKPYVFTDEDIEILNELLEFYTEHRGAK